MLLHRNASDILCINSLRCRINLHLISRMHGSQDFCLNPWWNVYINPRRLDGTVPQDLLHAADINPFFDQICCKRVPEHMRCNFLADPAFTGILSDHQPNRLLCVPISSVIHKEISALLDFSSVGCVITAHHIQDLSYNTTPFSPIQHFLNRLFSIFYLSPTYNYLYNC